MASKGSGRCAVLFKIIVGSIKPNDRMNDSVLRNMCPVSLFVSKTHWRSDDETLTMNRFAGEKAVPDLLIPAPLHQMSLFLVQPRDRVLRQRHFTATVEGSAEPGLDISPLYYKDSFLHDLTGIPFTRSETVLRCFYMCHPVDLACQMRGGSCAVLL